MFTKSQRHAKADVDCRLDSDCEVDSPDVGVCLDIAMQRQYRTVKRFVSNMHSQHDKLVRVKVTSCSMLDKMHTNGPSLRMCI